MVLTIAILGLTACTTSRYESRPGRDIVVNGRTYQTQDVYDVEESMQSTERELVWTEVWVGNSWHRCSPSCSVVVDRVLRESRRDEGGSS
ncbi:hypothetical protein AVJ23_00915 [Pseudoponticoccus marisrubri]|uniref:Uncharacterized protein n=1 Tax=Pseudoponticoccus marisrubri TaxID=1685382 RepID=A0A0W7WNZ3_9RHOB|nr:hypothetical protein AVJ23_00915 [Pseudoponticoccus marisrubri]